MIKIIGLLVLLGSFPGFLDAVGCPNTISRNFWASKPSTSVQYQPIPVEYAIIIHTVTPECFTTIDCSELVENMRSYHMDQLGWSDIAYNFLIGGDGNVYEARGWHTVGHHSTNWNDKSIGIAFIGNFENKLPTPQQLDVAKQLLECGVSQAELSYTYKLLGHRQVIATVSPGTMLYHEIQTWPHWVPQP